MDFDRFGKTALGQQLAAIIDAPESYIEMRAFSREGYPALAALISLLREPLERLRKTDQEAFDTAKRFCGRRAAMVMRRHGHAIVRQYVPCPGDLFGVATMWTGAPIATASAA